MIQPVVKAVVEPPVVKPVWQPVKCLYTRCATGFVKPVLVTRIHYSLVTVWFITRVVWVCLYTTLVNA